MLETVPTLTDKTTRDRIGPWSNDRLPALDAFAPDINFAVCAAAGSGKTTALVGRMLGLVRTGVPVEAIAAITFTRKAAGELRLRFYRELQQLQDLHERQGGLTAEELQHVAQALQDLPACEIATIHAFAGKILRENPEAVGVSTGFTEGIEETERDALAERFWQRYLAQQFEKSRDELNALEDLGVNLSDIRTFFSDIVKEGSIKPYVDGPEAPVDLSEAVKKVHRLLDEYLPHAPERLPKRSTVCPTLIAVTKAERLRSTRSLTDLADQVEFLSYFEKLYDENKDRGDITVSHWRGESKTQIKALRDEVLLPFLEDVIWPALRPAKAQIYRQIVDFVYSAVKAFKKERYATGQLTHTDVLHAARDLLKQDPDLRRRLQQDIRVVLVDEFQDTDPVQAELVFFLTGEHTDERDWRKTAPRPGSLFIVGDDKQSIYGFRGADMAVFDAVVGLIDAQPHGERVDLTTNFRSVPGLCDWVNTTFGEIFAADPEQHQATYEPLRAKPDAPAHQPAVCQHVVDGLDEGYKASTEKVTDLDAASIAEYIHSAWKNESPLISCSGSEHEVKGEPGDFMILTRDTRHLKRYARALAVLGIPYTVTGGKDAGQSEAVRGLVTLLSCVLRTDDPVARVAYLRGPLVGLSDDDLYALRKAFDVAYDAAEDGKKTDPFKKGTELSEPVHEHLDADLAARYEKACAWIDRAGELVSTQRPSIGLKRLIDETGLMSRALTERPEASLNAGRLRRVLAKVQTMEQEGRAWHDVLDYLRALAIGEETLDGMTLQEGVGGAEGEGANAVRVMNVHQAKGLQANVVFLAAPFKKGGGNNTAPMHHDRMNDRLILPITDWGRYNDTVKFGPLVWEAYAKEAQKTREETEEHRIQYVAATRAKYMLCVSRYLYDTKSATGKTASGPWKELYSTLNERPVLETFQKAEAHEPNTAEGPVLENIAAREATRTAALTTACTPTFATHSISEGDPDAPTNYDVLQKDGYGPEFGTAVHELLELAVQYREVTPNPAADAYLIMHTLQNVMGEGQVKNETLAAVREMVRRFLGSDLWHRINTAHRVHTEVPVAACAPVSSAETPTPDTLTRGVVDLLLQDPDGSWHLVDYKTNHLPDAATRERLKAYYELQLQGYADLLREQAGIDVATTGIWWGEGQEGVHHA
jgi:ATP-dependent helicase/nuclease subunit A